MKKTLQILKNGDTRIKKRFALFPVVIRKDNIREFRWLEMVTTKQVYRKTSIPHVNNFWQDIEFV